MIALVATDHSVDRDEHGRGLPALSRSPAREVDDLPVEEQVFGPGRALGGGCDFKVGDRRVGAPIEGGTPVRNQHRDGDLDTPDDPLHVLPPGGAENSGCDPLGGGELRRRLGEPLGGHHECLVRLQVIDDRPERPNLRKAYGIGVVLALDQDPFAAVVASDSDIDLMGDVALAPQRQVVHSVCSVSRWNVIAANRS